MSRALSPAQTMALILGMPLVLAVISPKLAKLQARHRDLLAQ